MIPNSGHRQPAKFLERPGTPLTRIGLSLASLRALAINCPGSPRNLEHGSALMVSRKRGSSGLSPSDFNSPCAAAPRRREGFQPLERRNLTLSRAVSILSGGDLSTRRMNCDGPRLREVRLLENGPMRRVPAGRRDLTLKPLTSKIRSGAGSVNPRNLIIAAGSGPRTSADQEPTGRELVTVEDRQALRTWTIARQRSMLDSEIEERLKSARREIEVPTFLAIVRVEYGDGSRVRVRGLFGRRQQAVQHKSTHSPRCELVLREPNSVPLIGGGQAGYLQRAASSAHVSTTKF
jgi:hypothetical protein